MKIRFANKTKSLGAVVVFFITTPGRADNTNTIDRPVAELADLSLQQLMQLEVPTVVTASKHEQKTSEAPASVTVVTSDDIKKYGYRTLADILRSVPGMYISYDRSYGYVGVRGFNLLGDYGGRVLILIDGHRLNDPIYDTAAVMTDFMLDVDLIDRVEVIKGPGSSLYGNNALFAVINVITRRGRDFNGPEASSSYGSFDTYKGRATYGQLFSNGVELVVSGTAFDSRGDQRLFYKDFNDPSTNNGIAENLDDDQFYSLFGHAAWRDLSLETGYISREKQAPSALFGTVFDDPHFVTFDDRGFAELKYSHDFPELGAVLARVFYDRYNYRADYPYNNVIPGDPTAIVLNRDVQLAEWVGAELQLSRTVFERHRLTMGAEYNYYFNLALRNFDTAPMTVYQDSNRTQLSVGVYAQDEYHVLDKLVLNAGVRFDYFYGDSRVDPRVAVIYDPRAGTTLKFVYGTAFRAPNAYERDYESSVNVSNPKLGPESISSYELIWEQAYGEHWRSTVAGFFNHVEDLIGQQTDTNGVISFQNVSMAESKGVELTLVGAWKTGLRGRLGYTFAEAEESNTGHLHNSPRHLAQANVIVPLFEDKLFAGLELQYTSSRTTLNRESVADFWVANFTLFSQPLGKHWEVSGSIYNLFDRHYNDPASDLPDTVPQDGRTFRIKITGRF